MCETYTLPYRRTLTDNQIHDIALAIATKKMNEESWNDVTEYEAGSWIWLSIYFWTLKVTFLLCKKESASFKMTSNSFLISL